MNTATLIVHAAEPSILSQLLGFMALGAAIVCLTVARIIVLERRQRRAQLDQAAAARRFRDQAGGFTPAELAAARADVDAWLDFPEGGTR